MPAPNRELRKLLPSPKESTDRSSSSSSEDLDRGLLENGAGVESSQKTPTLPQWIRCSAVGLNRRHQLNRGMRRLPRVFFCLLPVSMFLGMLYLPIYSNVPTRHMALPDWGFNVSRNMSDYVLPENDTTILEPQNICREKVFVLIVVCSGSANFAARQTIRETWGNTTEFNYAMFERLHAHLGSRSYLTPSKRRLLLYADYIGAVPSNGTTPVDPPAHIPVRITFLVGLNSYNNETNARIRSEAEHYNDIIQENFIDSYNNLTLKSVLALKWVGRRCLQQAAFFMKCDDDTFVNVPNLLHFLLGGTVPIYNDTVDFYAVRTMQAMDGRNRFQAVQNYLGGHLFCTARPVPDIMSKWYMPWYMFPGDRYPPYLSGAGYIMSMDVVPRLYASALSTPFIYLEDVYLTGVCANHIELHRRHHPLFGYTRSQELCSFKGSITQHDMKDDSLAEAYAFVANMSKHCAPPGRLIKKIRKHTTINSKNCV